MNAAPYRAKFVIGAANTSIPWLVNRSGSIGFLFLIFRDAAQVPSSRSKLPGP